MLYREVIAVCYEIHAKHINALCRQNVDCFNLLAPELLLFFLILARPVCKM